MSGGALALLGAVIVLGLAGLATAALKQQRAQFDQTAVATEAEVTNLSKGRVSGLVLDSKSYHVGYTYFTTSPGRGQVRHAGNYRISEYAFTQLQVGGKIQIRYLLGKPDVSRPAPEYLDDGVERSNAFTPFYFAGGIAIVLVILGISALSDDASRGAVTRQVVSAKQASLTEIRAAIDSKISAWRELATFKPVRLTAADSGFRSSSDAREVYYGNCNVKGETHFYVYVFYLIYTGKTSDTTWLAQGYGYSPGTGETAICLPEGWSAISDEPVEGDWHEVYLILPAQIPFFKLTETAQATRSK